MNLRKLVSLHVGRMSGMCLLLKFAIWPSVFFVATRTTDPVSVDWDN